MRCNGWIFFHATSCSTLAVTGSSLWVKEPEVEAATWEKSCVSMCSLSLLLPDSFSQEGNDFASLSYHSSGIPFLLWEWKMEPKHAEERQSDQWKSVNAFPRVKTESPYSLFCEEPVSLIFLSLFPSFTRSLCVSGPFLSFSLSFPSLPPPSGERMTCVVRQFNCRAVWGSSITRQESFGIFREWLFDRQS